MPSRNINSILQWQVEPVPTDTQQRLEDLANRLQNRPVRSQPSMIERMQAIIGQISLAHISLQSGSRTKYKARMAEVQDSLHMLSEVDRIRLLEFTTINIKYTRKLRNILRGVQERERKENELATS